MNDAPANSASDPQPTKASPPRRRRSRYRKLLFSLILVVAIAALPELFLAVFVPQKAWARLPDGLADSGKLPWGLWPSAEISVYSPEFGEYTIRTNRDGIADDSEHEVEKRAGCIRVLLLGDSFTEGYGCPIEHTFGHMAEHTLGSLLGPDRVEFIKAGVQGTLTSDQVRAFRVKWAAHRPDVVVLGIPLNDIQSNPAPAAESLRAAPAGGELNPQFRNPLAFSHTLLALQRLTLQWDSIYLERHLRPGRGHADFFSDPPTPWGQTQLANTAAWLRLLHADVRAAGGELHVLFIPQRVQALLARAPRGGLDPAAPARRLVKELANLDAGCLDLLPAIREFPPTETYFTMDGHMTRVGHAIVARELVGYLLVRTNAFAKD